MRVVIESPYQGDVARNVFYLDRCLKDSLEHGEFPIASHKIYPGILDDNIATERDRGIKAGYSWMSVAQAVIFYVDYGYSPGMRKAKRHAKKLGLFIAERKIGRNVL